MEYECTCIIMTSKRDDEVLVILHGSGMLVDRSILGEWSIPVFNQTFICFEEASSYW